MYGARFPTKFGIPLGCLLTCLQLLTVTTVNYATTLKVRVPAYSSVTAIISVTTLMASHNTEGPCACLQLSDSHHLCHHTDGVTQH
jgi:hypothetical protein